MTTTTDEIRVILEQIADTAGRLTPRTVLQAAAQPTHPLHGYFEWNDSIAGDQYRVQQARALIRSVPVVLLDPQSLTPVTVPFAIRDPDADPKVQGYRAMSKLQTDQDAARRALLAEIGRAVSALRRARDIASALGQREAIEPVLAAVARLAEPRQVAA